MSDRLGQPEYLHILANPFLTHALPFAVLALFLALVRRHQPGTRLALILVLLAAATVWPVVHYGELGYDRIKSVADATGGDWLDIHRHRAEESAWVFYAVAAVALAALIAPLKWPNRTAILAWLTLGVAIVACGVAAFVAYPAGRVRHREFRHGPPSAAELLESRAEDPAH